MICNKRLQTTHYELLPRSGFTIIELLVVIAIMVILASAAVPIYGNFQVSAQLNESSAQIVQSMRIARQKSIARTQAGAWGVFFNISGGDDQYILYQGTSYAVRDTDFDRSVTLDSAIALSTTIAGAEVNFSMGRGLPSATGDVVMTHSTGESRTVNVNSFGKIEE
jgi:type IV fimbrial biogenesis protein FimT